MKTMPFKVSVLLFIFIPFFSSSQDTFSDESLINAVKDKNIEKVIELTKQKKNINFQDSQGWSALHYACYNDFYEITDYLIKQGADIEIKNKNGSTPLILASSNFNYKICALLLQKNAKVNYQRPDGSTALFFSTQFNLGEISNKKIRNDPKFLDTIMPLLGYTNYLHENTVKILLKYGANPNITTIDGTSPLMVACYNNNLEIVKLLFAYGADVNLTNNDGLNSKAFHNENPYGNTETTKKLSDFLISPPNILFHLMNLGLDSLLITRLNDKNIDINKKDEFNNSLLHKAVFYNEINIVRLLIKKGANLNIQNDEGITPLLLSLYNSNIEIAIILIQSGANVNLADKKDVLPIEIAEQRHYNEVIELLHKKGTIPTNKFNPTAIIPIVEPYTNFYQHEIALSKDSNILLITNYDKIKVWDIKHQKILNEISLKGYDRFSNKIYTTKCNNNIAISNLGSNDKIYIIDFINDQIIGSIDLDRNLSSGGFIISPTSDDIICCNLDNITVYDFKTKRRKQKLFQNTCSLSSTLGISNDGKYLIVSQFEKTNTSEASYLSIFNISEGKEIKKLRVYSDPITRISFLNDNVHFISIDQKNLMKIWDIEGNLFSLNKEVDTKINSVDINKNDLLALNCERGIFFYDLQSNIIVDSIFPKHNGFVIKYINNNELFMFSDPKTPSIYNLIHKKTTEFKTQNNPISSIILSNDKSTLISGCKNGTVYLWDLKKMNPTTINAYNIPKDSATAYFSLDLNQSNDLLLTAKENNIKIWHYPQIEIYKDFDTTKIKGRFCYFISKDEILSVDHNKAIIFNFRSEKIISSVDVLEQYYWVNFNFDAKVLCLISAEKIQIINIIDNILVNKKILVANHGECYANAIISNDNKYIFIAKHIIRYIKYNNNIDDYSIITKTKLVDNTTTDSILCNIKNIVLPLIYILPTDNGILFSEDGGIIKLWNNDKTMSFQGHNNQITGFLYDSDRHILFSSSFDNTIKLTDLKTQREILKLIPIKNNDWAIMHDNYYSFSSKAYNMLGFKIAKDKVYSFDQFDNIYNRPDLILKSSPYFSDTILANNLYHAYLKRLDILKVNKINSLSVPELIITNEKSINSITTLPYVELKIKTWDNISKIEKLNVWVNNVPIFGHLGINLKNILKSTVDTTLTIPLNYGENNIQISSTNSQKIESLKAPINILYYPKEIKQPNLYIIGIGASLYERKQPLSNVEADVLDFVNLYKTQKGKLFKEVFDSLFLGSNVISEKIFKIKNWLKSTTINDYVIIYYSGHGEIDTTHNNKNYYLYTYDIEPSNVAKKAIKYDDFENLLDSIPARRKLMLINACKSGEFNKNMETFRLMKEKFPDLRRGTGTWVIASSNADQFSYTSQNFGKYSAFGKVLIEALQGNKVHSVNELKEYLEKYVFKLVDSQIKTQRPLFRSENLEMDFKIW